MGDIITIVEQPTKFEGSGKGVKYAWSRYREETLYFIKNKLVFIYRKLRKCCAWHLHSSL